MWGVLCLHLMGTMTTWIGPAMRVRNQSDCRSLGFSTRPGWYPGLRHVWGELGTGVPQTSLRYWPGTTTQTAQ